MMICVEGDYYIDDYYMVEDMGIVLGQVLVQVFGDKCGIWCYGECYLLMDDVQVCCVLDLLVWFYLVWNMDILMQKIGQFDIELVCEFFIVFVINGGIILYVDQIYGLNSYYIVEVVFKVVVWVLCIVVEIDLCKVGDILLIKGMFQVGIVLCCLLWCRSYFVKSVFGI